ncbi:Dabb family protein [Sphingobacterium sp. SGR-19]|uniref:Dabb family protein n=1 Tax=Sphingobacterium sp. SGR-19 TaxID=2710886 RepID=UPI0013EA4E7A|nr:Dabb family protein [Sphingobacterium sp. SGR-19]NGM65598.1 twin-arginine translocation signal domain-containing protein [Sphingobacterium sp. SGR-19]
MERRNFLKSAAVAGLTGTLLTSCTSEPAVQQAEKASSHLGSGIILHSVYFWLKEDISEEEEQDFLNFFEELRKVPGVQTLQYGKPAPTNPRPVVDNSFQYNLLVTFQNMEDINTYETHPKHTAAAEKYSKYWTKVEVRDTIIT